MPEITANIIVQPISLTVSQDNPGVNVTVDSTNLNLYTATAPSIIGGNVGELQYRAVGNVLNGIANSNVDANGNLVFTNLSNVKIVGGINGYYLQTDGTGNLTWAVGGGSGNGVVGGANTQVQYNDAGLFGGDASFTFDDSTQLLTVANLTVTDTLVATVANATFANVTNFYANFVSTPDLTVNSSLIRLGTGAGDANTPAQGIAIGLAAGNANLGLDAIAIGSRAGNSDQANNSIILNATGANLTTSTANSFTVKPVRNANTANILFYDDTTGEITYDSAPATNEILNGTSNVIIASANGNVSFNINAIPDIVVVSVGGINVSGTMDASLFVGDGWGLSNVPYANITGTPTLGNIASINLDGNSANYLNGNGGWSALDAVITTNNVALGANTTAASFYGVAIAGNATANAYGIAIGSSANAGQEAVAIGPSSTSAGTAPSIAVGKEANATGQESIAIGYQATANLLNGVALGEKARAFANNTIVINASGSNLYGNTTNAMFVKPVRSVLGGGLPAGFKQVAYNPTTGEFIYYD